MTSWLSCVLERFGGTLLGRGVEPVAAGLLADGLRAREHGQRVDPGLGAAAQHDLRRAAPVVQCVLGARPRQLLANVRHFGDAARRGEAALRLLVRPAHALDRLELQSMQRRRGGQQGIRSPQLAGETGLGAAMTPAFEHVVEGRRATLALLGGRRRRAAAVPVSRSPSAAHWASCIQWESLRMFGARPARSIHGPP